ncbi:hypothetical protein B296_00052685 [Ensete ventricosum]|uniref:Uncharacterized protein n=1 Tax=Ensete ventricosum TaxID=4639 RepID=A0A426YBB2_ENSVE|nr:hypothetical protein B296_00052685 [Ensete ventricosum]
MVVKVRHIRVLDVSYRAIWIRKMVTCFVGLKLPSQASNVDRRKLGGSTCLGFPRRKGILERAFPTWARNEFEESDDKVSGSGQLTGAGGVSVVLCSGGGHLAPNDSSSSG